MPVNIFNRAHNKLHDAGNKIVDDLCSVCQQSRNVKAVDPVGKALRYFPPLKAVNGPKHKLKQRIKAVYDSLKHRAPVNAGQRIGQEFADVLSYLLPINTINKVLERFDDSVNRGSDRLCGLVPINSVEKVLNGRRYGITYGVPFDLTDNAENEVYKGVPAVGKGLTDQIPLDIIKPPVDSLTDTLSKSLKVKLRQERIDNIKDGVKPVCKGFPHQIPVKAVHKAVKDFSDFSGPFNAFRTERVIDPVVNSLHDLVKSLSNPLAEIKILAVIPKVFKLLKQISQLVRENRINGDFLK